MPKRDPAYMLEQRERILDAALDCLIEKGLHDTSLTDICRRGELSVGAIYIHFSSKDDILHAVADRQLERAREESFPETWEEWRASLRDYMCWYGEHGGHARVRLAVQLVAEAYASETMRKLQERYIEVNREFLGKMLAGLKQRGQIALPLGLERTVSVILRLEAGAYFDALREQQVSWEAHGELLATAVEQLVQPVA